MQVGPAAEQPGGGRLDAIQVLRGLAAMAVVFNHAGLRVLERQEQLGASYLLPSIAVPRAGAIGVDLFFVISGFVMALSASNFSGPRGAAMFLALRYNRIAPLFYLACVVLLADRVRAGVDTDVLVILNSLTFIPFFDGAEYSWPLHYLGWTLAFEFVFYLVVAVLIAVGGGSRAFLLLAAVAVLPLAGLATGRGNVAWQMFTNPILWEFALGIVAYVWWRHGVLQRMRGALAVAALASTPLIWMALVQDAGPEAFIGAGDTVDGSISATRLFHWGVPSFLFFCVAIGGGSAAKSRRTVLLRRLGDASYSIYLTHLLVMIVSGKLLSMLPALPGGSADLALLVLLAVSAVVGVGVHRLLEQPMQVAGQRRVESWFGRSALRHPPGSPEAAAAHRLAHSKSKT